MSNERTRRQTTHAGLFSGIGGAEVAARWMGWRNVFHCEIQEFPRRVLEYHFPESVGYGDITRTDFRPWRGRVDVLTGGFPCQPFSLAGKRLGAQDDRYLWTEMLRAIREIQPAWVVGENVAGILTMVEPGEAAHVGGGGALFEQNHLYREERVFTIERVCRDLEQEGYAVQPFLIPACAVGAPHRRDRVWIVAHRTDAGTEILGQEREDALLPDGTAADTEVSGITRQRKQGQREEEPYGRSCEEIQARWREFPTQSPVCSRNDGFPVAMDGITFSKWRQESIKAYGNAWCPPVAYEIFKGIQKEIDKTL